MNLAQQKQKQGALENIDATYVTRPFPLALTGSPSERRGATSNTVSRSLLRRLCLGTVRGVSDVFGGG